MIEPSLPEKLHHLVADLQDLVQAGDRRGRVGNLIQTVLDLHGPALARLLELISQEGEAGRRILENASGDELVRSLLVLHGLHPLDLERRIEQAFGQVRPFLHSQGAEVELLAVAEEAVRLRLHQDNGYPASLQTLQAAVEEAVTTYAPDARLIEFVSLGESVSPPSTRVPLPILPGVGSR